MFLPVLRQRRVVGPGRFTWRDKETDEEIRTRNEAHDKVTVWNWNLRQGEEEKRKGDQRCGSDMCIGSGRKKTGFCNVIHA